MDEKYFNIIFPESIYNSPNYSNYSIAVYGILKLLSTSTGIKKQCVTPYQLSYLITDNDTQSRYVTNVAKCGVEELIRENVVTKINEVQKHYILDCTNLWFDTHRENFAIISANEMFSIFHIKNVNNFLLLKYFIFLISTLSSKVSVYVDADYKSSVVGYFTIDKLSELSGISVRSIIEYNSILEKNNLIYIRRQSDYVLDEKNNIKSLPNIYGRYENVSYINNFAENQQKYIGSYLYTKKTVEQVNDNRRLAQKYQQILKGKGEKYSESEILDIYNYVLKENQKYERLYNKSQNEDLLSRIRDTDIFEQFTFIKEIGGIKWGK